MSNDNDQYDDGKVLIAGVLYDEETLEEAEVEEEASDKLEAEHPELIWAWEAYDLAYIGVPDPEASASMTTVGDAIAIDAITASWLEARGIYLAELVKAGILRPDESIPDADTLWESHPANLRAELDA